MQPSRSFGPAFLLAQLGSHAARKYAERLAKLHLTPAHSGILYILAATPGLTQQALAGRLGMVPSRLVALLDELSAHGLIQRAADPDDRRRHALLLTEKGKKTLAAIGDVAREHQRLLLAALSEPEQQQLASLLQRVADQQGLTRNVHPGYKTLRTSTRRP
ncbi:MAG TPA: MarR family transcriptional regulator [Acidobacteriaceae bacterium]|nr:MarR family transcriptional regulator [Acidobacteriaceae bacterium]